MASRYSKEKLRSLRNQVPIARLIADYLCLPSKVSQSLPWT